MFYMCFLISITGADLLPDFFLEEGPESLRQKIVEQGGKPAFSGASKEAPAAGATSQVFKQIESLMNEELVKSINGIFQFNLKGNVQLVVFY